MTHSIIILTPLLDRCPIARGRCNFIQKYRINLLSFFWIFGKTILDLCENRITFQITGNHFPANVRQLIDCVKIIFDTLDRFFFFLFCAASRGHWHGKNMTCHSISFFSLHSFTYVFNYLLTGGD